MIFADVARLGAVQRVDTGGVDDVTSLFGDVSDDEQRAAAARLTEMEKTTASGFDDSRPAWLDGTTPPKTAVPNADEYNKALEQFGAKDSEEFRQKYLEGFKDEDFKWLTPNARPKAPVDPAKAAAQPSAKVVQKKSAPKKAPPQGIPVQERVEKKRSRVSVEEAAQQRVSNKKGMDQLWHEVPISGADRQRLVGVSKKEDPRFETLDLAIRKSGLGYSDQAIKKVLAKTTDTNSLNGSRERVTENLQSKAPYSIYLSNGIRRDLYRADLELKGNKFALDRFDFDVRVEDETSRIEAEFAKIKPKNNLHAAVLALSKENALKRAIDKIADDPSIDVRNPTDQQENINSVADGIQSALTSMMNSNPALQYLPAGVKQQIADYGVGVVRGGVQLAGTVKGVRDFVQDTGNDLLLSAIESTGLDEKFGVDTKSIRKEMKQSREKDAQLWRDLSTAQTARISRGELGYQKKRELGLRTTPYDVPNWAVTAGEITTKALPYLVVGVATGGASLPAQVAINGALGGLTAGGEVYNQTRNQPEAMKAAAWGVAQGAVMPLTNRLGYSGDLAASTAFDYVTQKIRNPNASNDELIHSMVTQAVTSGAFHTGSRLFRGLEKKTGYKLTPDTAKAAYFKMLETDLPTIKEEIATSSKKQTAAVVDKLAQQTKRTPNTDVPIRKPTDTGPPPIPKPETPLPKSLSKMRQELTPKQREALDRELLGRRLVDEKHFEEAKKSGKPNPELRYGRTDFEGFKRAEKIVMDAARQSEPLTIETLQKAHRELSGGFLPPAKRGLLRTASKQSAFQGSDQGGAIREVSRNELEALRSNPDLQIAEIGPSGDKFQVIVEYTAPAKVREKFQSALDRLEKRLAANEDPVTVAADAQREIVSIHPFEDGNGRISRLVMDYVFGRAGRPPPILRDPSLDTASTPEQWRALVREGANRPFEITREAWRRAQDGRP